MVNKKDLGMSYFPLTVTELIIVYLPPSLLAYIYILTRKTEKVL